GRNLPSSERMRNALYAVGAPILQSATSTILGVSFLASAESYVFRSFLKTIFLVILLGVLHGLVILPVLLTMFHCSCTSNKPEQAKDATPSISKTETLSPTPDVKYLASPDLYKFPPFEFSAPFLEYLKELGRPPDYHEASAPYPMRARLKYTKSPKLHLDRELEYHPSPSIQPR
ncbi:hypothetical protein TELCIR_20674, partial [Teladorsagia circumcincta]